MGTSVETRIELVDPYSAVSPRPARAITRPSRVCGCATARRTARQPAPRVLHCVPALQMTRRPPGRWSPLWPQASLRPRNGPHRSTSRTRTKHPDGPIAAPGGVGSSHPKNEFCDLPPPGGQEHTPIVDMESPATWFHVQDVVNDLVQQSEHAFKVFALTLWGQTVSSTRPDFMLSVAAKCRGPSPLRLDLNVPKELEIGESHGSSPQDAPPAPWRRWTALHRRSHWAGRHPRPTMATSLGRVTCAICPLASTSSGRTRCAGTSAPRSLSVALPSI